MPESLLQDPASEDPIRANRSVQITITVAKRTEVRIYFLHLRIYCLCYSGSLGVVSYVNKSKKSRALKIQLPLSLYSQNFQMHLVRLRPAYRSVISDLRRHLP